MFLKSDNYPPVQDSAFKPTLKIEAAELVLHFSFHEETK